MVTILAAIVYLLSCAACAHRIRFAEHARQCLIFVPFVVGAWVTLLTARTPTPINMTLNFLFVDMAIFGLAVTGIFRMLGGFEPTPPDGAAVAPSIEPPTDSAATRDATGRTADHAGGPP